MSGLDLLKEMIVRPPARPADHARRSISASPKSRTAAPCSRATPQLMHYNPLGTVHGGYTATLLDSCMGCAVHSTLPKGRRYTTLEFKVSLIRAVTAETGPVRAEGRIINSGPPCRHRRRQADRRQGPPAGACHDDVSGDGFAAESLIGNDQRPGDIFIKRVGTLFIR